jgi:hypothetical protein
MSNLDLLDVGLWQLHERSMTGDLAADAVLREMRRMLADNEQQREVIDSLRHSIEQYQHMEDRAHGLDSESSLYVDALQYTQGGRNEVLR